MPHSHTQQPFLAALSNKNPVFSNLDSVEGLKLDDQCRAPFQLQLLTLNIEP